MFVCAVVFWRAGLKGAAGKDSRICATLFGVGLLLSSTLHAGRPHGARLC
jgi:hypothetical protein